MRKDAALSIKKVGRLVNELFENDLHARRVVSLTNATAGAIEAGALGVHAIGHGLAEVAWLNPKHAIKQVDRLLGNEAVNPWDLAASWVPFVVGSREKILVAMDWTDFEADDHVTLAIHMVTSHGRTTPLLWKTVWKSKLAGTQSLIEAVLVRRLREVVPPNVHITLLADRGFGSQTLYALLDELSIDFVIRFRENIKVTDASGVTSTASSFVRKDGTATMLKNAAVTGDRYVLPAVVCVKAPRMKQAWCLASSVKTSAAAVVSLYGRRFTMKKVFGTRRTFASAWGFPLHVYRRSADEIACC